MSMGSSPRLIFWALVDSIRAKMGLSPTFVKAVGRPGEFAMVTSPSSYPGKLHSKFLSITRLTSLTLGFVSVFAQGNTPFEQSPNLVAPRVAFEIMSARHGLALKGARCHVLLVIAKEDDLVPARTGREIAASATASE